MADRTDVTEGTWSKSLRSNISIPAMGTCIRQRWPQLICILFSLSPNFLSPMTYFWLVALHK